MRRDRYEWIIIGLGFLGVAVIAGPSVVMWVLGA